jgi:hypothetical protein
MHDWRASESRHRKKGLGNCLKGDMTVSGSGKWTDYAIPTSRSAAYVDY